MRMGIHWHRLSKSHDYEDVTGRTVRTPSADCARIATIVILCRNLLAFCYVVVSVKVKLVQFLADRTNGRAYATVLRLSSSSSVVCLSVTLCIVAKRCVLEQKLLLRAYRKSYMRNRLVPK